MAAELAYSEIGSELGKERLQAAYENCSIVGILSDPLLRQKIYRTAFRILRNEADAEEASQETYLNIWRGLPNFRGDSKFSTWVSRITVNAALGFLRKRGKTESYSLEQMREDMEVDVTDERANSDKIVANSEIRDKIALAPSQMSPKQAEVVRLHDYEGYTIAEIARRLKIPAGTVKSRLFYGRQEFREYAQWTENELNDILIADISTTPSLNVARGKNGYNNTIVDLSTQPQLIRHERTIRPQPEHYFKPSYLDRSNIVLEYLVDRLAAELESQLSCAKTLLKKPSKQNAANEISDDFINWEEVILQAQPNTEEMIEAFQEYVACARNAEKRPNVETFDILHSHFCDQVQKIQLNWWDFAKQDREMRLDALKTLAEKQFGSLFSVTGDQLAKYVWEKQRFHKKYYNGYRKSRVKADLTDLRRKEYEKDSF
ncbi:MAG: RNA polymerase sigma factor [Candidatus Aenigmarchaeota archaeon]|nr:RNA polymerase sigma factor [Candidatus Aenigmarchaeota archaeon]